MKDKAMPADLGCGEAKKVKKVASTPVGATLN